MLTAAGLAALFAGTVAEIWNPPPYRRWPLLTLIVAGVILVAFVAQSFVPDLLPVLSRDPRMLASGEIWRALTALFVQDGGVGSLLSDLFWLLVLGSTAERRLPRGGWLAVYFLGGIVSEFLALGWQPRGTGNSVACFALAGALCGDWRDGAWRWWRAGVGIAGVIAAFVMLLDDDINGIGFLVGFAIGLGVAAWQHSIARSRQNVVAFTAGTTTLH